MSGLAVDNFLPSYFRRCFALVSKHIEAARQRDHLGDPVTGCVKRLEPFQTNNARPIARFGVTDLLDTPAELTG